MSNKYKPFEYKKEDVDCKLCLYYSHGFCCRVRCCCLEEKLKLDSPILNWLDKKIQEDLHYDLLMLKQKNM